MQGAVEHPDAFVTADIAFHAMLLAASHNELLEQLIGAVGAALRASIAVTAQVPGAPERSLPLHAAVLAGVQARDEAAAEAAMRLLIGVTVQDIERGLHRPPSETGER
jgi:DNA-binding FadR family transcriptional regulator